MLTAHARFWRRSLSRAYSAIAMENPVLEAPVHRGMQQLDRSAFNQQLTLLAARLPAAKTTQFMHKDAKESVWVPFIARESRRWESKLTSALCFHATQLRPPVTRNRTCQPGSVRTAPESVAPNRRQMYALAAWKGDQAERYPDAQNPHSTAALPAEVVELVNRSGGEVVEHQVQLDYDFWSAGGLSSRGKPARERAELTRSACRNRQRRPDPAGCPAGGTLGRIADSFHTSGTHR